MVLKEVPSGTPNRTDPEIGSVRESGDEAGDKQHPVVR